MSAALYRPLPTSVLKFPPFQHTMIIILTMCVNSTQNDNGNWYLRDLSIPIWWRFQSLCLQDGMPRSYLLPGTPQRHSWCISGWDRVVPGRSPQVCQSRLSRTPHQHASTCHSDLRLYSTWWKWTTQNIHLITGYVTFTWNIFLN